MSHRHLLLLLFPLALAAPASDEIHSLPGWSGPLPCRMYSGFVDVEMAPRETMHVHYWFMLNETASDKTLLWTNGGPGASSMFGILVELGPLLTNVDSLQTPEYDETGVPSLIRNPYSWTGLGSVLMFDWPPPVGLSYCGDDPADLDACGTWDDDSMAALSYAVLRGWYSLFPERFGQDLYIVGESYAGVYVPRLVDKILDEGGTSLSPRALPLKGFAVGDGCAGTEVLCGGGGGGDGGAWWQLIFLYGHGQISNALFDSILETCGVDYLKNGGNSAVPHAGCADLLREMNEEAGGYYEYNLYDECTYSNGLRRRRRLGAVNDYVCAGDSQDVWVNQTSVKEALNVPPDSVFFTVDGDDSFYSLTEKNVMPIYRRASERGLKVLVYNGDTDPGINSFVSQNWTTHLGFDETQSWRPWTLDSCRRVAGYVTRYESARFDFLTIRGSGHMVPQFKPQAAYTFLSSWLDNVEYPLYDPTCHDPLDAISRPGMQLIFS